jgi:hypothetical protein
MSDITLVDVPWKKGEHMAGKMKQLKPYIKKQETRMRKLNTSTGTILN